MNLVAPGSIEGRIRVQSSGKAALFSALFDSDHDDVDFGLRANFWRPMAGQELQSASMQEAERKDRALQLDPATWEALRAAEQSSLEEPGRVDQSGRAA